MSDDTMDYDDGWIVYERTQQGEQEILDRRNKLPPTMRATLIAIDGKNNKWSILNRFPKAEAARCLTELETQGYIVRNQSSVEDEQRRSMMIHDSSATPLYKSDTARLIYIIAAALIVAVAVLVNVNVRGGELGILFLVLYVVPLIPTVLLFVAKSIRSTALMKASMAVGTLPSIFTLFLIIGTAQGGNRNYGPLFLLLLSVPWLVIRIPAYLLCKVKDKQFHKLNNALEIMCGVDGILLIITGVGVSSGLAK